MATLAMEKNQVEDLYRINGDSTIESNISSSSTVISSLPDLSQHDELIVEKLGKALDAVAKQGDMVRNSAASRDCFENGSGNAPSISVKSYLKRMLKYIDGGLGSSSWSSLSPGARALISCIIYIDRIVSKTGMTVNSQRVHRLIAVGILVALKMNEDAYVDMTFFSSLAGIPSLELKVLERKFLEMLDWDAFVSGTDFKVRLATFQRLTRKQGH